MPHSLSVSIVTFRSDLACLKRTLETLAAAIGHARSAGALRAAKLALIDNGSTRREVGAIMELGTMIFGDADVAVTVAHGHANIGFGAAHNLALHDAYADFHLVLNPDVEMAPDALTEGLKFFAANPSVGVIAPASFAPSGEREYLCKRYPSVLVLAVRGFAPRFLRRLFRERLDDYEMRDAIGELELSPIPLMSGCFLLVRKSVIDKTGGFDPAFFLYFEDFDWTYRLNRVTGSAYVPEMRIVHHGGDAARKGLAHVVYFVKSACRFFNKHGWKLA